MDFVELVRQEQAAGRMQEEVKLEEVKLEEELSEGYLEAVREVNQMLLDDALLEDRLPERRGSDIENNRVAQGIQIPPVPVFERRRSI